MPVAIPTMRLARHCNPFTNSPWGTKVTRRDVQNALADRRLVSLPDTDDHAGRIAYLVENEAEDAIEVDVGVPALNCYTSWLVQDGNHRLAAAIYANRPTIKASVGGQMDYAMELFGVDCCEQEYGENNSPVPQS
ncbi:hypothetical protein [Polaromonas sp.]|uniref:hypothetical protein n=1 Tax=Polaromonas sp. TaxID=1869339 RepID=UPI00352B4D53